MIPLVTRQLPLLSLSLRSQALERINRMPNGVNVLPSSGRVFFTARGVQEAWGEITSVYLTVAIPANTITALTAMKKDPLDGHVMPSSDMFQFRLNVLAMTAQAEARSVAREIHGFLEDDNIILTKKTFAKGE